MGIDTTWKERLQERYPQCWLHTMPEGINADCVIEDIPVNIRKYISHIKSAKDIRARICNKIERIYNNTPSIKEFIAVIDEPAYIPICKQITQEARTDSLNVQPYTSQEIARFKWTIADDVMLPDMERFMATRSLHPELYKYFTSVLMCNPLPSSPESDNVIVIDGAIIPSEVNGHFTNKVCYAIVDRKSDRPYIYQESKIGESDIKIAKHISQRPVGTFYVISHDTDLIPILLLSVRDWINPDDGMIHKTVYLDTNHDCNALEDRSDRLKKLKKNEVNDDMDIDGEILSNTDSLTSTKKTSANKAQMRKGVLDIVTLWRAILEDFEREFPAIEDPVEIMVMMMIMCKTDYVEGLPGVKSKTLFDAFKCFGKRLMYQYESILTKDAFMNNDILLPHRITLAEHKVYQWIVCIYYHKLNKNPPKDINIFGFEQHYIPKDLLSYISGGNGIGNQKRCMLDITMASLRKKMKDNADARVKKRLNSNNAPKIQREDAKIPLDEHLISFIRRISWNLDYWANGWKPCGYYDPIKVHPESKLSLFGWIYHSDFVDGIEKMRVMLAPVIHK